MWTRITVATRMRAFLACLSLPSFSGSLGG